MGSGSKTVLMLTRLRFNLGLLLDLCTRWVAVWGIAAAVFVLVLKVSGGFLGILPWHVLLTGIPVALAAAVVAWTKRYDTHTVAAWLDLQGRFGGRVIDAAARGGSVQAPGVRASIRPLPLLGRLAIPLVLVVASLVVPWSVRAGDEQSDVAIKRRARVVEHRIESARRMGILDQEEALALMEQLDRARQNAQASPESAAEAVDQVQKNLDREILDSAKQGQQGMQAASDLMQKASAEANLSDEEVQKAMEEAMEGMDPQDLPEELREAMEKMKKGGAGAEGAGQGQGKPLDPEQAKKLGQMLQKMQGEKLEKLGQATDLMVDPDARKALGEMAEAGGQCEGGGDPSGTGMEGIGQGSITRGPGEAPLEFGDETDPAGARFEPLPFKPDDEFLPSLIPGSKQGPGSTSAPAEFQPPGRSEFTVKSGEGGFDSGSPLSPYHDDVVTEYFSNEGSDP